MNTIQKKKQKEHNIKSIATSKIFLSTVYIHIFVANKKMHYFDRYLKINIKYNYVFY